MQLSLALCLDLGRAARGHCLCQSQGRPRLSARRCVCVWVVCVSCENADAHLQAHSYNTRTCMDKDLHAHAISRGCRNSRMRQLTPTHARIQAHVATAVGGDKRGGGVGCLTSPMPLIRVTSCPQTRSTITQFQTQFHTCNSTHARTRTHTHTIV